MSAQAVTFGQAIAKARKAQRQRFAGAMGGAKGNLLLTGKPLPEA